MSRGGIAAIILAALAGSPRALATVGDITWSQNNHAASKYLDGLGAPGTASDPHTAAITLGFVTPGNCLLQSTGIDGSVICAANPVGSITFTDPATNTGTSTNPIIGVKFSNVSIVLNGGGALVRNAFTGGDVTAPIDSNLLTIVNNAVTFAKFQQLPPRTIVANVGGFTANAGALSSSSSGDTFWNNAGTLVAAPYPYSALAGAPGSLPPSGAATNDLGGSYPGPTVLAAEFGAQRLAFSTAADGSLLKRSGTTVVGATAGADFATTVRADGIVTGTLQLASISAANMLDGAIAWVDTVGDFFRLTQSALATTATTVVTASGKAGYQWVRMNVQNVANQLVATWYLDPLSVVAACNDENTGLSSAVPLCTMSEIARRTAGASYPLNGTACVIFLESSKPTTDRAVFNYSVNGKTTSTLNPGGFDAPLMVIGVPTDLGFAGVVSSAQNGALGSTQDIHFTDSGIPTSFTASGFLATNVIFHKTSGTPGWFWPALDLGAKTLRASQINTGFATYATFSNGDTYRPQSLPNFNATTFPLIVSELPVAAVFGVTVTDAVGSDPAASNPGIMWFEDSFVNLHQHAGWYINDQFIDQQFFASASYGNRFGGFIYSGLGRATGAPTQWVFKLGSTWLLSDEGLGFTTLEKVKYTVDVSGDGERIQAQFFDNTSSILNLLQGSFVNFATIGGSGNSGNIVNVSSSASRVTYTVAPPAGMTSNSTPIQVRGTNYAVSALPVADPTTGAFVVPDTGGPGWGGDLSGINQNPAVIGLTGGGVDHPIDTLTSGQALAVSAGTGHIVSLAALAAPGSSGILVWTGSADVARTLTNGDGTINFGNPDGVAGNPEIHVNAIPESKVTGLTADLAGKVPTTRNINTTAPMTGGGSLAGDLTLAVPVFAGSTAGLVPPSSGGTTNFLRADGTYAAPSGAAGVTQGTGPVTFIGPGVAATAINFAGGSISGVLALGNEGSPTGTGFAHVTGGAWDPAARAVNLGGSDVTGALPVGSIAVGVGTSGQVPTIVGSSVIWATPSSPGTGTVTNVSGVPGDVNVANPTSTPSISLPDVGPGSVTTGGSGIQSVTTDHAGRIVSIATAAYQPALSFPPAHYITDSTGSGLTGDASFQREPGTNLIDVAGLVVNGASPFPNSALIVNNSTNTNRDRIQLYVGGGTAPAAAPTGDSTLVGVFPHDTALEPGVVSGIYATMRIENLTYTGSGQTITEAAGLYIDGPPNLSSVSGQTYALHVATGQTKLGGPLALPALPNGTLVTDGAGNVSAVDPGSTKRVVLSWTSQLSQASGVNWNVPFYEMIGTAGVTNVPVTPMSLGVVSGDVMPRNAVISLHVVDNVLVDSGGTCTLDFRIRENGTPLAASSTLITSGTSNGATIATKISVLTSALSSFDVQIATANCGGSSGILVTTNMIVY